MSGEYSVVPYSIEHRRAVLDLHRQLMPRRRGQNERYFAWKYEENPYLPTPTIALVFHGSDLVAMRGLYGTRWVDPERGPTTVPAAEDLIVDERHRDRGLFLLIDKELRRLATELGCGSIISLSGTPTTQRLQAVAGWEKVRDLDRVYRIATRPLYPVRNQEVVRKLIGRSSRLRSRAGVGFRQRPSDAIVDRALDGVAAVSKFVEVSGEPDIASSAALSTAPTNACRPERTEEFYRWRLQNPDRRYRFVSWNDPACRGFAVLAFVPQDHQRVMIVDGGAATVDIMVEILGALTGAPRLTYELMPTALPDEVRGDLAALGFVPAGEDLRERPTALYARETSSDLASLPTGATPWQVNLIDTMLA